MAPCHVDKTRLGNRDGKHRVATLIDNVYLVCRHAIALHYLPLGVVADGDDAVGIDTGTAELEVVDLSVDEMIAMRMAEKDEVVDGDHRLA